ncbi:unnamed protein product [Haemonchus placei]|uniref:Tyrosinase_Cu-bd domain-containing protein n=1 Tax=Haemonchus placei TaxID=6290 RepID=A0A0N4W319_HAEPC|nr:unnamed protein product [Haemonchus placei]
MSRKMWSFSKCVGADIMIRRPQKISVYGLNEVIVVNGSVHKNGCLLPGGKILEKAHRQEIRTLDDNKRKQFEDALNWMKVSGLYNRIARVHKYSGVHSGPAFTLWHREYLKRFELVIRHYLPDPNMGVPYWDSTLDAELPEPKDSMILSDIFLGTSNEDGFVVTGPYANWTTMEGRASIYREVGENESGELLNNARVDWIVNNPDINMVLGTTMPLTSCSLNLSLDSRMLEYSHDYVHFFIGGDMGKSHSSSNDVVFLYHHSMVDLIYEQWRQKMQSRTERERDYPASDEKCFPPWHNADSIMPMLHPLTNRDALSNGYTDEMYEFAPRPTCTRALPNCKSKYLFCHVPKNGEAQCMGKIRLGGKCTGFEGTEICFIGECVNGICELHRKPPPKLKKTDQGDWYM